ncbi:tetratricopeptide (TPR) repeat protein [Pedobacter sp. AK017]|uniref:RagB/SusD family nutrient uptake outer membrane protein n=1 Tax=Pedobacter sp. AK017 TaxID=2723073 RepID=UPI00160D49EC|nr:RagB/SusD family nutrient uptake outer membrane protein [Pedobacter sp. AK017]MBB5441256.1 tetratricopeptide (TPR) repeat protein [Pedobacter sp. AK017]
MNNYKYLLLLSLAVFSSCGKEFLEAKPDKALLVPTTLSDMQALLNNTANIFNKSPYLTVLASDDFYTSTAGWQGLSVIPEKNAYIWAKDVYESKSIGDWNNAYKQIFYANVVLDGLLKIETNDQASFNQIKGSALFYRAWAYYKLAEQFCAPYQNTTAATTPGIMLHLNSNVNERPGRGNLRQLYDQLIDDLVTASPLLSVSVDIKTKPSKAAALALLSKVYLAMERYDLALKYADEALAISSRLIDYNTLTLTAARPFPNPLTGVNDEVLFYSASTAATLNAALTLVDSTLYKSYTSNDLRRQAFFKDAGKGLVTFKGTYSGSIGATTFFGLSVDEIYLIKAECEVRQGRTNEGIKTLNLLLEKRWLKNTFKPYQETNQDLALSIILAERRKELIARDTRWTDLRRLNSDARFQVTLKRVINNQVYELPPGDNRYVFPLPDNELSEHVIQNTR